MSELSQDNIIVHGLWIGNKISSLEVLTIKSFIRAGHTFYLWLYKPLDTLLPKEVICKDANTIIPEHHVFYYKKKNQFGHGKGSLAGFSDIFRYKLLYDHGGWWVDMDVTCIKPLQFDTPYVFRTHHELKVVGNIMKCPKGSEMMKDCYEIAIREVDENNTDWNKPIAILNEMIEKYHLSSYIFDFSNQDSWNIIRILLKNRVAIPDHWKVVHWVNEEWRRNHISKEYVIKNSSFHYYLLENKIETKTARNIKKLKYLCKLLWIYAAITQSGSYSLRNIMKKLTI